jgi:hypothetical protein
MAMMQTPTASVVMMVVITIRNGGDADTARELGGDGGDHYQQWE